MERIPDWAGTQPQNLDEWFSRLSNRTKNLLNKFDIQCLDQAVRIRKDCAIESFFGPSKKYKGIGALALKEMEMAEGIFWPESSDLDTSDCWICNGKIGNSPNYCSRHCAYLNDMRGSWRKFINPDGIKGSAREKRHSDIIQKAVRRWLRLYKPTIMCEKDADIWVKKFDEAIRRKEWKRYFYREGYSKFQNSRCFFYEGSERKVGCMWVNGEIVRILPSGALTVMNQMRKVAERSVMAAS